MIKIYKPRKQNRTVSKTVPVAEIKPVASAQDIEDCKHGACISPSEWYQRAQIAFQRSILQLPVEFIKSQREKEWHILDQFWSEHVSSMAIPTRGRRVSQKASIIPAKSHPMGKAIYISGPPGTGKSAMVASFLSSKQPFDHTVHVIQVNCMAINDPKKLQRHLIEQWYTEEGHDNKSGVKRSRNSVNSDRASSVASMYSESHQNRQFQIDKWEALKAMFMSSKCSRLHVLVLDEMDQLIQSGSSASGSSSTYGAGGSAQSGASSEQQPSFLYHLFECSQMPNSNLVLIGIANAMDLMHHWIPRFSAHQLPQPQQCHFAPFTIEQTMIMLQQRIQSSIAQSGSGPCSCIESHKTMPSELHARKHKGFHPVALELCARKVASMGDFRKALDLCRLTVERAEKDYFDHLIMPDACFTDSHLSKENVLSSVAHDVKSKITTEHRYLVQLPHVQQAIALVFSSPLIQTMMDLNLHHQLVLLSIHITSQGKQEASFPLVLQKYTQLCQEKQMQMLPLTRAEFQDSLTLLEGKGLILMKKGSTAMLSSSITYTKKKKSGSFGGCEGMMVKHMETKMNLRCHIDELWKGLAHIPMLSSLMETHIQQSHNT